MSVGRQSGVSVGSDLRRSRASLAAVRAGPADCAAPPDAALGGDLLSAVEAAAGVVVVIGEVLGDELQAVDAAGKLGRAVGVDGELGLLSAYRAVTQPEGTMPSPRGSTGRGS